MMYLDLLGKDFAWGGRGPATFDCYGLYRELHFRRTGILLPDYPSAVSGDANFSTMLKATEDGMWRRLNAPEPGCAVLFRVREMFHIGFVLDAWDFIHIIEGTRVTVERLDSMLWKNTIIGYYRWEGE
jgi:cell wall-associated NlpC family hydrolase